MGRYIGALDQGTTSTRFIVFDNRGAPLSVAQKEIRHYTPEPGMVEQNPEDYVKNAIECIDGAVEKLEGVSASEIECIGLTNQRETTIVWDRQTGKPLYNALVWSDSRTSDTARELSERPGADEVSKVCGLPISTYFAAVKIRWLLDNVDKVRETYDRGDLCFSTVDSWMIYRLTGEYCTDTTNASRSMLMDLETLQYSDRMKAFFGVEKLNLPEIRASSDDFGRLTASRLAGVPVTGCLGDQSSALVGQLGFHEGDVKNTYGTGCFLLYNTGHKPTRSDNGLISTVLFNRRVNGENRCLYALEGSIAVAGSVIKWFRNNVGLIELSSQIGDLANEVDDNGGVCFVTAFSGLFAPYWKPNATGTIVGLSQHTTKSHLARAAIEAVCFQTKALLDLMVQESSTRFSRLRVDGGMTSSNVAMQAQADILGKNTEVERPAMREPTALGAAIAAGLYVGIWDDLDHVEADLKDTMTRGGKTFTGQWSKSKVKREYHRFNAAVKAACVYGDELDKYEETDDEEEGDD
ncbi:hypothetical protein TRICI_006856 [Trichomonascus ciferrii]|uniref:glycerol kinase n=1 Tax=Trichomonascus ciferrii TaxID=44093 RepID=A0A642UC41_9ASCO|nr:hypothetical protein TRICI_006856 [Trichomonascus ciferrii]